MGDRFVIRPDVDVEDAQAVGKLAADITAWVMAQRERVQADIDISGVLDGHQPSSPPIGRRTVTEEGA